MIAFRKDIQGLRAIAVLSVLLFHLEASRFKGGFVGVDVFFVISGYLITKQILTNLLNNTFTLADFYKKRIRRLFPALFATVALTFVGAFFLLTPKLFEQFGKSAVASVLSVSNILFWSEAGYFDTAAYLKPLLHMWSLSVEEQFYLIWPLTMMLLWRARWPVLGVIVVAGIASFAAYILFPFSQSDGFFLMPFRIFQFAAGAAVIWLERYRLPSKVTEGILLLGLVLILLSVTKLKPGDGFPGVNALPPTLGAMLVIYAGRAQHVGLALRNSVMVWVGTISYSLYLVHWPIIVFYGYQTGALMTSKMEKLGLIIACFAAGALLFYGVEKKFRSQYHPVRLPRLAAFAACLAALAATAAFGDGWTWRVSNHSVIEASDGEYGGEQCKPPRCSSGPSNRRTDFYVMGDSHSRAYFAGLAERFSKKHIVFFEASGCPFYSLEYTIYYSKNPEEDRKCRSARHMAFDEIKSSPAPVLLAQNWDGTDMISERTEIYRESSPNMRAFVDFLGVELLKIHNEIAPILYVIGNVPTTGGRMTPEDCMDRPFFAKDCRSAPLTNFALTSRSRFNQALAAKVADFAKFVDPYAAICDTDRCFSILDDKPLYSDNRHLSRVGSIRVISGLKTQLQELDR